ncbi:protein mono-ADP-ribosyltransferase PARP14-like isoform X1 [Xyrichtys novacula]|uniref:Poly [ADP-ribose] polymerase n=1 Tax=Xyrichtys novacula TaxID=13765 RepID=A0AAV1HJ61_XYRNO|nr:protein mono-ADP-ribosyltransferase PARP14-like isoform X1 [Xyrichtys novacula]
MGDPYQYPVFFDYPGLDAELKKRIKTFFEVGRRGGDCSPLTNIKDNTYRIDFKDQDAQQRVLQKSEHVLKLAGGPLVLTVRDSPTQKGKSLNPVLDFSPSQQKQQPSLASSQRPCDDEYELKRDPYLLRYFKESPKASQELEKELPSASCSAKFYPDEGRVLIQGLSQPDAAHDVTNWKAKVDKVFDEFLCHYEAESRKIKALLQSYGSPQTTDEVKVYNEAGLAVVVGKRSQVKAMLVDVDSRIKRGTQSDKKQTNCRLGKAKLSLLWKEIQHNLGESFPEVKVTQTNDGQIVLEGSLEEIRKAGDLISDMEKSVLERTVSGVSLHFLAFLRKAYGEPGVLGDILGVGDNVEIELRDAGLHIYTLSADKLDDTEKKLHKKFKEDRFYIPNCSTVPSELREKLKCKASSMNQEQCRAQFVFGSDNKVHLQGHTEEFEALKGVVEQFILDEASIEGKLILPFPELAQQLPELLHLHKFDDSGVTIRPLTSSSRPMVLLEGPSGKVTEVRNRLGPFLDSLVKDRVIVDMPGAGRYFENPSGREDILRVARSQKCLLQFQEQPHISRKDLASGTVATYCLHEGLKVLVCNGDITKQDADAIVNAANERLDHGGGVAGALSKAGGPEVQKESSLLVKQNGKISTGRAVVTTGGNLKCKKLLHAVGPVGGKSGGRESELLEKTIQSALDLAEVMEFKSIAIPCISSGLFGVPVKVCSEAIVTAVKKFCSQGDRSLNKIILIDDREEVVRAMQDACDRILRVNPEGTSASAPDTARGASAGLPGDGVRFEVIQGTLETQQVDCLVCPMAGHDPVSTVVGQILVREEPQLAAKFHQEAKGATLPSDIVIVKDIVALSSKGVAFLNLIPWDNNQDGTAVKVLRQSIKKILAFCGIRGYSSVALPVLGAGGVLRFPHSVASRVILEEVQAFEKSRVDRTSFLIRCVIHPNNKESSKAFQSAQKHLHLRGFTNDVNPDQASFYRHVSNTNDEVTAMLGEVKLQIVNDNIIHETTDVIVNTTDFSRNQFGVSKAILTAAGPTVEADFAKVGVPADRYHTTGAGLLGCKEIIHASFHCDQQIIRKTCIKILKQCESKGFCSAAFPAINTGAARMDYFTACKAMLDGMTAAITDLKPKSLSLIRIVILDQAVYQAFRLELENRFGQTATPHLTLREKAMKLLKKLQNQRTAKASATPDKTFLSFKPPPVTMNVISCGGPQTIRTIKRDLEGFLQMQLVEKKVDVQDFSRLEPMELEAVQAKISLFAISLEYQRLQGSGRSDRNSTGNTARGETQSLSDSGREVYVLKGLKEDVLSVTELINKAIQKALCEDLQDKEEAMLALTTQWSILDPVCGAWQELSLHDNFLLEGAHSRNEVLVDVTAPDGMKVTVNVRAREATNWTTGATHKVKRSMSGTTLDLPTHWEPMEGETFKKVELQPSSTEYQGVAQGFLRTANYNICKIERVQNVYLWHAYTVCRERIFAKNGRAELGERFLYHGTSAESCECIEKNKFDRGYAGQHAAVYGKGVYFAVNADYSARGYSPLDASGLKRLYVTRVLTGRCTKGNSQLKAAPPRGSDRTDCYDSVVDNCQAPTMYVIFHDDQAYPEYLITFRQ